MGSFDRFSNFQLDLLHGVEDYIGALLDLIYPPRLNCIVCNKCLHTNDKYGICSSCMGEISFIGEQSCQKCSKPMFNQGGVVLCCDCKQNQYFFKKSLSVVEYKGLIQDLIYRFKYYDTTYLSRSMALMMAEVIKRENIYADAIIPVPLHPRRRKERGYNQSLLLAKYIGRETKISHKSNNLIRVKYTRVMHNLSRRERQDNLTDAFELRDRDFIYGKDLLLIDDIFTSGATANACSRVLIEGGAKSVIVVTFARGV